jgi:hypothetical protein
MPTESSEQQANITGFMEQASAALGQGDYPQAERLFKNALELLDNNHAEDAQETAVCLQNLAEIYYLSGQLHEAIPCYRRLLSIGERILGEGHPDVLATMFRLALTYDAVQMPKEADEIYKQVTNSAERSLGLDHPFSNKIRESYFAFMSNRAPSDEADFRFALTPPLPSPAKFQPDALEFDTITDSEEFGGRTRTAKKLSSYKRPTKIKHLRYGADSAEDEVSTKKGMRHVWQHWRIVAVAVPVFIAFLVMTFIALSKVHPEYHPIGQEQVLAQLAKLGNFQSVDGVTGVNFLEGEAATLQNDFHHARIPCTVLQSANDFFGAVLTSAFTRRENWYRLDQDRLVAETGTILYSKKAPELFIGSKMRALKQFAQRYYLKTGCYPNDAKKWNQDPDLDYISPFTGRVDSPGVKNINGTLDRETIFPHIKQTNAPNEIIEFLRNGGIWQNEGKATPGRISALALFVAQRCADGFKVNEFYVRGFDRDSQPLTGGKGGTLFIIGLKNGKDLSTEAEDHSEDTERSSFHPPDRICILCGEGPDLGQLHNGLPFLLGGTLLGSLTGWIFLEFRKRLAEPKRLPQPFEVGFAISLIFLLIISIIRMLP